MFTGSLRGILSVLLSTRASFCFCPTSAFCDFEKGLFEAFDMLQVVVAFKANWCGPCRMMAPVYSELSRKFPQTIFLKIDVDEMQDISAQWNVQAMPTFIIIKDSKERDRVVGANKEELEKRLTFHVQNFSKS
ncbi:hypothetical protein L7F22_024943 [Adiantum nelumboides]|nr:hypothetical protein [Adiantum nelumboides]